MTGLIGVGPDDGRARALTPETEGTMLFGLGDGPEHGRLPAFVGEVEAPGLSGARSIDRTASGRKPDSHSSSRWMDEASSPSPLTWPVSFRASGGRVRIALPDGSDRARKSSTSAGFMKYTLAPASAPPEPPPTRKSQVVPRRTT